MNAQALAFKERLIQKARRKSVVSFVVLVMVSSLISPLAYSQRTRQLDFEDSVVEGVNKKPLDSLAQISDGDDRKKKKHLYFKKSHFDSETKNTLRETRLVQ